MNVNTSKQIKALTKKIALLHEEHLKLVQKVEAVAQPSVDLDAQEQEALAADDRLLHDPDYNDEAHREWMAQQMKLSKLAEEDQQSLTADVDAHAATTEEEPAIAEIHRLRSLMDSAGDLIQVLAIQIIQVGSQREARQQMASALLQVSMGLRRP